MNRRNFSQKLLLAIPLLGGMSSFDFNDETIKNDGSTLILTWDSKLGHYTHSEMEYYNKSDLVLFSVGNLGNVYVYVKD